MATPPRNIEDFAYYHLYNRGNHKDPIFHQPRDYERFLWALTDAAAEYGVGIHAYCLMPNHYHALVRQLGGGSLPSMMTSATVSFVKHYNRAYGQVGHLFQGPFQTRRITTTTDLAHISSYIHANPVNLAPLEKYEWSSYRAYLGESNRFCDPRPVLKRIELTSPSSYATFVNDVKTRRVPAAKP